MFYDYEEKQPIDTFDTLVSYYQSNTAKITELNVTNELLKRQITSLMRQKNLISILTCTSTKTYDKVIKYMNKKIKRGHEDYKLAKDSYNYIVSELQKISTQITEIKEIMLRMGFSYTTVGIGLIFDLNGNEFELYVPMCENITIDDVFHSNYIDTHINEFQLYVRTSSCSTTCIWTGTDISKINSEVDLTKQYALK